MEGNIIIDESTGKRYKLVEVKEESKKKKVAFVIGHTSKDKGAYSNFLKISEWDMFKNFSEGFLQEVGDIFFHNPNISYYTKRQEETAAKTKDYEIVFELHFNAASPSAEGCEALYYHGNEKAKALCNKFCSLMESKMQMKNRGAKALKPKGINGKDENDRGFGFVSKQKPTAIILEPFFSSNPSDCDKFSPSIYKSVIVELIENL